MALDRNRPIDLLASLAGIKMVDDVLGRLQHGVFQHVYSAKIRVRTLMPVALSRASGAPGYFTASPRPCRSGNVSSRLPTLCSSLDKSSNRSVTTWMTSPSRCTRPWQAIMPAVMTSPRYRSKMLGQTMRLATPASSSMVMNSTPLAVPGF